MIDLTLAIDHLRLSDLTKEHRDLLLPLIAKTDKDRHRLMLKDAFAAIVHGAKHYARELSDEQATQLLMGSQEVLS
jgi:hypothetical protein